MKNKYKITGFARFIIFFLIFTPIVLIGVRFYKTGELPSSVYDIFQLEEPTISEKISDLEKEINSLELKLERKRSELQELQNSAIEPG